MFIWIPTELLSNWITLLTILFSCLHFVNSNEYRIGYNDGYRDAKEMLTNRFRDRSSQPFGGRRQTIKRNEPQDYEDTEDYGSDDYEQYERMRGSHQRRAKNYGNTFNQNVLNRGLSQMSEGCRQLIRPEFGTCIEKAANKFDTKEENLLSENNCKTIWLLMCCSEDLISKKCGSGEAKAIEMGFITIQKTLELKGCSTSPRRTYKCSND